MQKRIITLVLAVCVLLLSMGVAYAQNGNGQTGSPSDLPENQIFKTILDEHTDVTILFNRLETMMNQDDMGNGQTLFNQLATALATHGAAEEQVVYPLLMDNGGGDNATACTTDGLGEKLAQEHHAADLLLYELLNTPMDSALWQPKLQALEAIVIDHLKTEMLYLDVFMQAVGDGDTTELATEFEDASNQAMMEIESQGLAAYFEQAVCAPILGMQQEFCIVTGEAGPANGGDNGGNGNGGTAGGAAGG